MKKLNKTEEKKIRAIADLYRREDTILKEIEAVANDSDGTTLNLSPNAFDYLFDLHSSDMPYGTQKARDGDPYEWLDEYVLADYRSSTRVVSKDK